MPTDVIHQNVELCQQKLTKKNGSVFLARKPPVPQHSTSVLDWICLISHLLSAVSHRLGLTLFQIAIEQTTNKILLHHQCVGSHRY